MDETRITPEGRPQGTTLADITLERRVGNKTELYSGEQLATLLDATRDTPDLWESYTGSRGIALELHGLAAVVAALGDVDELDVTPAYGYVEQQMVRLANRVMALELCENAKAAWYALRLKDRRA